MRISSLQFKIASLAFAFTSALYLNSNAQETDFYDSYVTNTSSIKDRWNFKVGYTHYDTNAHTGNQFGISDLTIGNYRIEANYGISNLIESGVYVGYSKMETVRKNEDNTASFKAANTFFYGITANFHVVPILTKAENPIFDLYLTGKIGGVNFLSQKDFYPRGLDFEYGLGSGLSFYILKNFGIYGEFCYGNYFYDTFFYARTGIALRFK